MEIGTWVRHKYLGTVHKVKSINDGEFDNKISVTNSNSFDNEYMNEYIPWLPKEDDYIWDSHYRSLGKVTYSDDKTISYIDILDRPNGKQLTTSLINCEPFFGSLPTFYQNSLNNKKDNQMISTDKQYTTRDGRQVRIYATDAGGDYPVHGAIFQEEGNYYSTQAWKNHGGYYGEGSNKRDLIEVWVPEVNELCWFWNNGFKFMILGQYIKASDVTGFYICRGSLLGYQRIAKYVIGEFPEYLKELE